MQPQLLQKLSEEVLGHRFTWVPSVQEKSLQVQRPLQFGSEKCLWSCSAGQETEFADGREDEVQRARGEAKTLLSGWQAADVRGVSSL